MRALAFHGGTALRFLYSLARFSEDLDFALERPGAGYDLAEMARQIKEETEKFAQLVKAGRVTLD